MLRIGVAWSGHVFAIESALQGRQGAPLLEYRREPALSSGKVVQRQVLYLGEIGDGQHDDWSRCDRSVLTRMRNATPSCRFFLPIASFPGQAEGYGVQVRLDAMELHRPRQWGACWLSCELYEQLGLDQFWARRLRPSREGNELVRYPARRWCATG